MNTDRFNEVYKQFISNIIKRFKLGEKELIQCIDKNISSNNNYYVDFFIKNLLSHIDEVSACNIDFFKYNESGILLCDTLEFKEIIIRLQKGKNTDNDFHKICTYIMTLYLVLLKDENKIEKYVNANYCDYEAYSQMISVINSKDSIVENWKANNNDKHEEVAEKKKEEDHKKEVKEEESKKSNGGGMPFPFGDIENTQIGKLAGELAEKIEKDGNVEMPNITNPSDIFSMMFSGDKNNPIGNIMNTVCSELDSKIKNGELDQGKLFSEAQGLMGSSGMFNPEEMMKNMAGMAGMPGMPDFNKKKDTSQNKKENKIKIKRKKKVPKKPPKLDNLTKDEKIMEEAFNEVINE